MSHCAICDAALAKADPVTSFIAGYVTGTVEERTVFCAEICDRHRAQIDAHVERALAEMPALPGGAS